MRWLLFLSRVAFVCNLFFLVAFSLTIRAWIQDASLTSTVIIAGYVLGILVNPLTVFSYLFVLVFRREKLKIVPLWLIIMNVIFLFLQLFYILYLNIEPPNNS